MTYSAVITELHSRAATYVGKILKGTKPGDLPIEQPTKCEFIINLKAAKVLGLTIPPRWEPYALIGPVRIWCSEASCHSCG